MKLKKIIAAVMAGVLLAGVSACSKDKDKDEFDPEEYLSDFYTALLIDHDFDHVFECSVPDELYDEIERSYLSDFDDPPADYDLYEYEKRSYEGVIEYEDEEGYSDFWFKIISCEEVEDPADDGQDPGTPVYSAVVKWGCTMPDGDDYEETEDDLTIYCLNGSWYLNGKFW